MDKIQSYCPSRASSKPPPDTRSAHHVSELSDQVCKEAENSTLWDLCKHSEESAGIPAQKQSNAKMRAYIWEMEVGRQTIRSKTTYTTDGSFTAKLPEVLGGILVKRAEEVHKEQPFCESSTLCRARLERGKEPESLNNSFMLWGWKNVENPWSWRMADADKFLDVKSVSFVADRLHNFSKTTHSWRLTRYSSRNCTSALKGQHRSRGNCISIQIAEVCRKHHPPTHNEDLTTQSLQVPWRGITTFFSLFMLFSRSKWLLWQRATVRPPSFTLTVGWPELPFWCLSTGAPI